MPGLLFASSKYTLTKWIERKRHLDTPGSPLKPFPAWGRRTEVQRRSSVALGGVFLPPVKKKKKKTCLIKLDLFNRVEFPSDPRLDKSMVLRLLIKCHFS